MEQLQLIPRIKEVFEKGENVIQFLRSIEGRTSNTIEDILISYDFQAGNYIKFADENSSYVDAYTSAITKVLNGLGQFNSILEVGVGEATTLGNLALKLSKGITLSGFDVSWSRVNCGRNYLTRKNVDARLFVGDLFNTPLRDSSVDIVYTSHSVEPNGGREREALQELYRITTKYLILLEPTNEFANEEGKNRMNKNGYVQNLRVEIAPWLITRSA